MKNVVGGGMSEANIRGIFDGFAIDLKNQLGEIVGVVLWHTHAREI